MFRKMRRFKQALSDEECRDLIRSQVRGVLSVIGDDGYPYGLPIDFWYDEENGNFYFHMAKAGHKIDALKKCDKASFCIYETGTREEGDWALNVRSVIAFGRVRPVEDPARMRVVLENLCKRFPAAPPDYVDMEYAKSGRAVLCMEFVTEHMTGKKVNES